jgi:hypothetical protein
VAAGTGGGDRSLYEDRWQDFKRIVGVVLFHLGLNQPRPILNGSVPSRDKFVKAQPLLQRRPSRTNSLRRTRSDSVRIVVIGLWRSPDRGVIPAG